MKLIEQKCKEDCHKLFGVDPDFIVYRNMGDEFGKNYTARKFYEAGWRAAIAELADIIRECGLPSTADEIKIFGEEEI